MRGLLHAFESGEPVLTPAGMQAKRTSVTWVKVLRDLHLHRKMSVPRHDNPGGNYLGISGDSKKLIYTGVAGISVGTFSQFDPEIPLGICASG